MRIEVLILMTFFFFKLTFKVILVLSVAAIVGRLAPNLTSLNLSNSLLLHLPKAGMLLASPSIKHGKQNKMSLSDFVIAIRYTPVVENFYLNFCRRRPARGSFGL